MTQSENRSDLDNDDIPAFLRAGREATPPPPASSPVPKSPFECREVDGEYQIAMPFSRAYREPKAWTVADEPMLPAFATIGAEVVSAAHYYAPAFKVAATVNASDIFQVQRLVANPSLIPVIDRVQMRVTFLLVYRSVFEAVVSWFSRSSNEGKVLCLDRAKNEWYLDAVKEDLTIMLGASGREVANSDECVSVAYRVDLHPNGLIAYGE